LSGRLALGSLVPAITVFYLLLFGPLIVVALVLGAIERRPVLRRGRRCWWWIAIGLASGLGGLAVAAAYAWLHGTLVPGDPVAVAGRYIALGVALTLFQVAAEEVMFRGWLYPALAERTGQAGGIVLSSLAFAAFHLVGGAEAAMSLANIMLGGVWFALLAWRSGGLLAPIAAHFGWNIAEDLGLGLVPNPGVGELGALRNYDLTGPALWGGSAEGLNASVVMTIVIVALIVPLAWSRRSAEPVERAAAI
jgi:membrane protease YdiL (CAAX protease family)